MFATRADLLARTNAVRLMQLAVPADYEIPLDERALRTVIETGDPASVPGYEEALASALDAVDRCLIDAGLLLVSYGIPEEIETPLLARLTSTVAIYYLQGAERMTEDIKDAYEAVLELLDRWRKGELPGLVPDDGTGTDLGGGAEILSGPKRYT